MVKFLNLFDYVRRKIVDRVYDANSYESLFVIKKKNIQLYRLLIKILLYDFLQVTYYKIYNNYFVPQNVMDLYNLLYHERNINLIDEVIKCDKMVLLLFDATREKYHSREYEKLLFANSFNKLKNEFAFIKDDPLFILGDLSLYANNLLIEENFNAKLFMEGLINHLTNKMGRFNKHQFKKIIMMMKTINNNYFDSIINFMLDSNCYEGEFSIDNIIDGYLKANTNINKYNEKCDCYISIIGADRYRSDLDGIIENMEDDCDQIFDKYDEEYDSIEGLLRVIYTDLVQVVTYDKVNQLYDEQGIIINLFEENLYNYDSFKNFILCNDLSFLLEYIEKREYYMVYEDFFTVFADNVDLVEMIRINPYLITDCIIAARKNEELRNYLIVDRIMQIYDSFKTPLLEEQLDDNDNSFAIENVLYNFVNYLIENVQDVDPNLIAIMCNSHYFTNEVVNYGDELVKLIEEFYNKKRKKHE